ncbi:hypothetical protein A2U01_0118283, partial [Trifolium medium]|nr:hypothetical protein [Trifolium medium]
MAGYCVCWAETHDLGPTVQSRTGAPQVVMLEH